MASRSTQRSGWILFHFFVLFGASYALGVLFLHITVSLCKDKDPAVEDVGKSKQASPSSTSTENSNQTPRNRASHSTSPSQVPDNDVVTLSPSHILSTSRAASVSRTLTLHLYLAATDSNSSQHNLTPLDSHGHSDITALKMGLYTLPSKHSSVGHVYLYPNSTVSDR